MTTQADQNTVITKETSTDDYDSPWKDAIDHYFSDFLAVYFPNAFKQIDWTKDYVFLDQELSAVVQDAELGKRYVDKLVRVTLLNGDEKWIYIHIEVQGKRQKQFAKRLFVYNYRIFDRYDRPVASLVVLADAYPNWKPCFYHYEVLGCQHRLDFPMAKLTDYHDKLNVLQHDDNPFAIITAAHILTQQTKKDHDARFAAKYSLLKALLKRQWDKQKIIDLLRIIDWMMHLPKHLAHKLRQEINSLEEHEKMRYVTSFERLAKAEGREEGRELWTLEAERKTLNRQLHYRFQNIPDWAVERIANASQTELEHWLDNVLSANSVEGVFDELAAVH